MYKSQQKLSYKRKIQINSLEAALCNVALFKSMKDKEFKDSIFISYCEEGVILEAISQNQWKRAYEHIRNFLDHKKISQLTYGYEKEQYEELINRGLKQYTRRVKERSQECPYINIIHFQKLRKSCQYMDKEKYVEPLKDWEKKNKKNPNFAFLIVEPKHKFDDVKRSLLQFLMNKTVNLNISYLHPFYFMYLFFNSPIKDKLRDAYQRKLLEISISDEEKDKKIEAVNFTEFDLEEYGFSIVDGSKNISKWGIDYISSKQLREQMKNAKIYCRQNPLSLLTIIDEEISEKYMQNYSLIAYKRKQQEKYRMMIQKFSNTGLSKIEVLRKFQKNAICSLDDIEFLTTISDNKLFKASKVCINNCAYMVHEYEVSEVDIDAFLIYMQQLSFYYCTYFIRFYGIALKYKPMPTTLGKEKHIPQIQTIYLIFDYHKTSISYMNENDMILDNMQIGTIMLQLLYLIKFLHQHEQPRCLGSFTMSQIFWPMAMCLPYLGANQDEQGIQADIKKVAELMKELLGKDEEKQDDFDNLLHMMLQDNKYDRPSIEKCIQQFQQVLCL